LGLRAIENHDLGQRRLGRVTSLRPFDVRPDYRNALAPFAAQPYLRIELLRMMRFIRPAVSALLSLSVVSLLAFTVADRQTAQASDTADGHRGALVFHTQSCERCHSITGVGGDRAPDLGSVGKRLRPNQIKTQILQGGHGMPPFHHVLTNDQVKDLVVFLASCRTDAPPGCREWAAPPPPQ
jgi:mono/diheme cytochrome c family protein